MKKSLTFILFIFAISTFAQSYKSNSIIVNIKQEFIPAELVIVPNTICFVDEDNNGVVDANESCKIRFQVENKGRGDGFGCVAHVSYSGCTNGIMISDVPLSLIKAGEKQWVEIPIVSNSDTRTGDLALKIVVAEPHGFDTEQIKYKIGTHKLKTPYIQVSDYLVVGSQSGRLEKRKTFKVQVNVQNTDQGLAQNVKVELVLPPNISWVGGTVRVINIPTLNPNETKTFTYELIANNSAADKVDLAVRLSENTGKYSQDSNISLAFGSYVGGEIALEENRRDKDIHIERSKLTSDVDQNIPIVDVKNNNTFVVIIANENYRDVESVPFALNDGNIFREYCIKTLGIPSNHINYIPNATGNQIKQTITWLNNFCNAYKKDKPRVIFYYAGHGIPDESSKTAYLLPVDGTGSDVTTGYKLDDLYLALGNLSAENVVIFMDACFSGSKREEGMIADARGVAIKAKSGQPHGNMVVFSASQGDETAYPNAQQKHGMFTYFLLKKLQESKGVVKLSELQDYIIEEVGREAMNVNGKPQTPTVVSSSMVGNEWSSWTLR